MLEGAGEEGEGEGEGGGELHRQKQEPQHLGCGEKISSPHPILWCAASAYGVQGFGF